MIQPKLQAAIQTAVNNLFPDYAGIASLSKPSQSQHGDLATSVALSLGKNYRQKPMDIAKQLVLELEKQEEIIPNLVTANIVQPGFINFTIQDQVLFSQLKAQQTRAEAHPDRPGQGQTVMVEFSSPNIAKPFNVGHLRSTIIGDSVARIFSYLGYEVLKDNHLGDWGTQYGKLAYAVEEWGDWDEIEADPIPELYKLYVRINEETEKDESLQQAAQDYFKRLEEGDEHVRQIWQKLCQLSQVEFDRLYDKFDIHFDMMHGEAFYEPYLQEVVQDCIEAGIAEESQGALVVPMDDPKLQEPPLMIRKSNGSSTYATRDLAGIKYRFQHYKLDRLVIEIGQEQEFYFRQIIAASQKMGWVKEGQLVHIGHGLFLGASGKKLSTRRGETVWLDELVEELEQRAQQIVADKSPELPEEQRLAIAESVAIGALKYNDLSQNRLSNIVFDKEKALSLEGNSAPYLQYTIARARSVLSQAQAPFEFDDTNLEQLSPAEREVAECLVHFNQVVEQASLEYLPNSIANYLFQTAQKFNSFYQADPILKADEPMRSRRLALTQAVANVLTLGLSLLGVPASERM